MRATATIATFAALVIGACSESEPPAPFTETVTLRDPGDEPRAPVRLTPRPDAPTVLGDALRLGTSFGEPISTTLITTHLGTPRENADGTIVYDSAVAENVTTYVSSDTPPESESTKAEATTLTRTGRYVMPERAAPPRAEDINPTVFESIAFPTEPIGVGASWTVRREIHATVSHDLISGLAKSELTIDAELIERSDHSVTLRVRIELSYTLSQHDVPDFEFVQVAEGTQVYDLAFGLPVEGELEITYDQRGATITGTSTRTTVEPTP